jgi:putative tricarboxylic transport membrane protein
MRFGGLLIVGLAALVTYWQNNDSGELLMLTVFAVVGVGLKLCGWNRWLVVAAFAISPMFEQSIRQTSVLTRGDLSAALTRPVVATLVAIVAFMIAAMIVVAIVRFVRTPSEAGA